MRKIIFSMYLLSMVMWFGGCDPCGLFPPGCVNGICTPFVGTCECDDGYEGEICDAEINECDPEPCLNGGTCADLLADYECTCIDDYFGKNCEIGFCEPPSCEAYTAIEAGQLDPKGCETYIGAHLVYPDDLLCCSAPSSGSGPECGRGDIPDIPCVIKYEFCDNGSAMKAWSPDPKLGVPGHASSTSGSWRIDSETGELRVETISPAMGGVMDTVNNETFSTAFTYDNGNKLDLNSPAAVIINTGGFGSYESHTTNATEITGMWGATMSVLMDTYVNVTDTGYVSNYERNVICEPVGSMVCMVLPQELIVTNTSGTHTMPVDLFVTPAGTEIFQTEASKGLVFERQIDLLCVGIECGEHGSCDKGVCECTDGYIGEFCDVPGPCVGVDCGENGTCAEGICECDTGYEGEKCEDDINECDQSPCLNGGTCAESAPGTYICTCIDNYTGDNCQNCPSDTDGDGYGDGLDSTCINHPGVDCDDIHATVYPCAPELCDGLDNQCPGDVVGYGIIDEGYMDCGYMVPIDYGCFNMGDPFAEGWLDELPVHEVCLSAFEMDIHEITNAEYAECVAGGGCTPPSSFSSYTRGTYYGDPGHNNYPVIWMEWKQVDDYCAWAGKRLPTEAEWEYAARGGLEGKRYPWGDTISSTDANYNFNTWDGDTSPVESYAPNDYGLYDMAGNVWEWVADWFDENYYSNSPANDPTGPASGKARVKRGGSFDHSEFGLRVANRCDFCHVDRHGNNLGGRCARDAP